MCGITGIFDYRNSRSVDETLLRQMTRSITHRGPDGEGFYFDHPAGLGLGHRRLSIIDLTSGDQPMSNIQEDVWIVFNGEIYNFPELKTQLRQHGYEFRTTSDTEVIIYMYQEYSEKSFEMLNGMFAFALYDKNKKTLFLVRDHFGVKPLYYANIQGRIVFGSEIKPILMDRSYQKEIDTSALTTFLTFRYNPSPQSMFKDIRKLPPAHYLKVTAGGEMDIVSYRDYKPVTNFAISENDAVEQYARLLEAAVKRQMISDVPVGLMLSGGIDSAIVGHFMQSFSSSKIKTFSIGFPGKGDHNELEDAKATASFIGSDHYEMTIAQEDYLEFFFRSFHYTEEPIAEPTIPALFYVSKLASKHLKVVLAGQGADEPLAGYKRYFGEKYLTRFSSLLRFVPLNLLAAALPRNERFKRAAYASRFTTELQRFLGIYTIFTPEQKRSLFLHEFGKLADQEQENQIQRLYDQTSGLHDSLSKILFIDTRMYLSDDLLIFGDKMSMANSLEMRVPFLDVELIRFLESLPSHLKLRGTTHKYIHKQALKKHLPVSMINRKKRGFATPIDQWLQTNLGDRIKELVNSKDSACAKYFNVQYIHSLIDGHRQRKHNYQRQLFALLSFELWYNNFFVSSDKPEAD